MVVQLIVGEVAVGVSENERIGVEVVSAQSKRETIKRKVEDFLLVTFKSSHSGKGFETLDKLVL
jgi:hypothetical protein